MRTTTDRHATISVRLERVTNELREIQELLKQEENVDPRILTDFRDAVNRVRNTAWAVEQYANSKTTETDPQTVVSVLAGERVRVAYQLCRLIQADLSTEGIQFQKGQLLRFRDVATELERQLGEAVGE
jgi:two-component sensor histidine kinase